MGLTGRTVFVNGNPLEYMLERKQVKNINLRVRTDGSVYASAHPSVPASRVDAFVMEQEPRIRRAQIRFREMEPSDPGPKEYAAGSTVVINGETMVLDVRRGMKDRVLTDGTRLVLEMKNPEDSPKARRLVETFLKQKCQEVFGEIVGEIYPAFQRLGVPVPEIRIRRMKSRWGSCMPGKGVITLNSQLLAAPRACIEYVVMHEFCHFIHPNHSRNFYALQSAMMPDWKTRKQRLQEKQEAK